MADTLFLIHNTFEEVKTQDLSSVLRVQNLVGDLITEVIKDHVSLVRHVLLIQERDDYTYEHSLQVGVLAAVIGYFMGYSHNELKQLITGTILHDIGKCLIPIEILNKTGALSSEEFDVIKNHTTLGFRVLEGDCLARDVISIPLQHHERLDGKGYPASRMGSDIHEFARIAGVSDVYSALTANRVYRKKWNPFEAIEYILVHSGLVFYPEIVRRFLEYLGSVYLGSVVRLNTGEVRLVVEVNSQVPCDRKLNWCTIPRGKP